MGVSLFYCDSPTTTIALVPEGPPTLRSGFGDGAYRLSWEEWNHVTWYPSLVPVIGANPVLGYFQVPAKFPMLRKFLLTVPTYYVSWIMESIYRNVSLIKASHKTCCSITCSSSHALGTRKKLREKGKQGAKSHWNCPLLHDLWIFWWNERRHFTLALEIGITTIKHSVLNLKQFFEALPFLKYSQAFFKNVILLYHQPKVINCTI